MSEIRTRRALRKCHEVIVVGYEVQKGLKLDEAQELEDDLCEIIDKRHRVLDDNADDVSSSDFE